MSALTELYRTVKQHGKFTDSPRERVQGLLLSLITSESLPNMVLGGTIIATVRWQVVGGVPRFYIAVLWCAWGLAVLLYAIGEEVRVAVKAAAEEWESDPTSDAPYQ